MNYMKIVKEDYENSLDGIGVTLFVSGCEDHKHCKGCHNPESWDKNAGQEFTEETYKELLNAVLKDYISVLTISGGDPLSKCNIEEVLSIINRIRKDTRDKKELRIWLYTGFELEDIDIKRLRDVNVVIFGPFIQEKRDYTCKIRGSKNQRIIELIKTSRSVKIKQYKNEADYLGGR